MTLQVAENISLELVNRSHAKAIFDMVEQNRSYLSTWLPFVDNMKSIEFAENFVDSTIRHNQNNIEFAFVIVFENVIVGRIGLYKIDHQNKIGEIGYWIVMDYQGKGIIYKSSIAVINFAFEILKLNRIELKCGTANSSSQNVARSLNFSFEGVLREAEVFKTKTIDLQLYSLIKADVLK